MLKGATREQTPPYHLSTFYWREGLTALRDGLRSLPPWSLQQLPPCRRAHLRWPREELFSLLWTRSENPQCSRDTAWFRTGLSRKHLRWCEQQSDRPPRC